MEVIIEQTAEAASERAAGIVAQIVRDKFNAVLGLATGATPQLLYEKLIELHRNGKLDFGGVSTFNLDEYVGLAGTDPHSYRAYMEQHFFKHINISPESTYLPDGLCADILAHCQAYEAEITARGGIDCQILGIGRDGHIGFNEPSSSLSSRTRIKTLTSRTRADNAHFFGSREAVPHHVITMGIGTILESRRCLLLAFGKHKAKAVAQMVEGPVSAMVPASALQLHRSAVVIMDRRAASKLRKADYYQYVYQHKPKWQL